MNTSEYAPRTSGSAARAPASMPWSAAPSSAGRVNSAVSTSVSDVAPVPSPAGEPFAFVPLWRADASTSAASSRVLIRLPLWPSARLADGVARKVGWAFCHTDDPLVEYRQCPTAMWPRSVLSTDSSNTCGTRPMSLKTTILLPSLTAIPADSWPRCCSA
jgi:hypothetical protein